MKIFTIGSKGRAAKNFFTTLRQKGVQKVIDVRRKNTSQLAGYTKGPDLQFFLEECFRIEYEHIPEFGPSEQLLKEYQTRLRKKKKDDAAWAYYVERFKDEVLSRPIVGRFQQATEGFVSVCLLCSEEIADCCHRRLLAEHFKEHLPDIEI
ncbi:MAG: DUF488 domain-containing protein, partial [Sedimentisphaerales bacterium]|nr:DUF488 domain-containing protein [Sedimentisphaerales bacterium]